MEEQQTTSWKSKMFNKPNLTHLHQSAVNKALQSPNGHLDLFLRFLLGLSLETNQTLLQGLMKQTKNSKTEETVEFIKKKISEDVSVERSINLFHCLNEVNDRSLVEEIQQSLKSGRLSTDKLSPAQWSALVFMLLSSENNLDEFDLKTYFASEEALLRLLPVVKASNKALLRDCKLSKRSCEALSQSWKRSPVELIPIQGLEVEIEVENMLMDHHNQSSPQAKGIFSSSRAKISPPQAERWSLHLSAERPATQAEGTQGTGVERNIPKRGRTLET
ncbi:NLR family CARD domain-containing protein 3-like [Mugil cephalus]|uniref:NLR family CARD domain-containing protein 3-like n=1 Tax=Mugil cephalus TaxID=48193 RepID=UPI001FB5DC0B|nr:NLR family CARD domain-containing protein 3-like [Mugil cephalus]